MRGRKLLDYCWLQTIFSASILFIPLTPTLSLKGRGGKTLVLQGLARLMGNDKLKGKGEKTFYHKGLPDLWTMISHKGGGSFFLCPFANFVLGFLTFCFLTLVSPDAGFSLEEVRVQLKDGSLLLGKLKNADAEKIQLEFSDGSSREVSFSDLSNISFTSSYDSEAQVHVDKAKQFIELGMDDYALEELKAAIRQSPKYALAHYELGELLLKRGEVEEALRSYGRSATFNPGKYSDFNMSQKFKSIGDIFLGQSDFSKAAEAYYQLFSLFPRHPASEDAAFKAAFLFADELKQPDRAIDALKRAMIVYPQNPKVPSATYKLGTLYLLKSNPNLTVDTLEDFIKKYPDSDLIHSAYLTLAKGYAASGQKRLAAKALSKVISSSQDAALVAEANNMMSENIWSVYTVSDGLPSNSIHAVEMDGGYIWVGTASGLAKFKISDGALKLESSELSGTDVRTLAADGKSLWVGTLNSGVMQYDKASKSWKRFSEKDGLTAGRAQVIKVWGDEVWLGSFNSGVWRYSAASGKWAPVSGKNSQAPIETSTLGFSGQKVWAGTARRGIFVYDKASQLWERYSDEDVLESNSIKSCAAAKNSVWFGWYDDLKNGIIYYDLKENGWKEAFTLTDYSFARDHSEPTDTIQLASTQTEILVATYAGIFIYELDKGVWKEPFGYPKQLKEYPVRCIYADKKSIWCGTSSGLERLDRTILED